jgi:hypothetical protein
MARFRLLTIVRTATPIFVIGIVPPLLAILVLARTSEPTFRAAAEELLGPHATLALWAWIAHALILLSACVASGKVKLPHDGPFFIVLPDLMDTAPVGPHARFCGEAVGTFGAMATIHACCLPLLAAVAALSPMPTSMFVWMEAGLVVLMILCSAGAAWQRRAPLRKFSATRGVRNAIVMAILLLLTVPLATRWREFRDALVTFLLDPSIRKWGEVTRTVENPLLWAVLFAVLYAGSIAYYYTTSIWNRARS